MGRKDQIASAQCCKPYGLQCEVMSTATGLPRLAGVASCKSPAHPLHAFYLAQMTLFSRFATSLAPTSFGPHTQHAAKGVASRQAGRKKPRAQMQEDCAAGRQISCAYSSHSFSLAHSRSDSRIQVLLMRSETSASARLPRWRPKRLYSRFTVKLTCNC